MNFENLLKEANYKAVRSGGKGGQHVNKVSTKVELSFAVLNSAFLSADQKEILMLKLSSRINEEGILRLTCDSERSQFSNKELVSKKLLSLVQKSLTPKKKRIPSKPSKSAKEKRRKMKEEISEKKLLRMKIKPMRE